MTDELHKRKLDHIEIVRRQAVEPAMSAFSGYRLPTKALPELDYDEIEMGTSFLGKEMRFPFLISSMTGGPKLAAQINRNLALAAEARGVALALGSMRVILQDPAAAASFRVRQLCPRVPLLANLGLVQLNYGVGLAEIQRLVDTIEADGLFLHVNALQEAIQPEGDRNFKGLLSKLGKLVPKLKVPILIKEVGAGIERETARRLLELGVSWIDVGGVGGTSWAQVEGYRRADGLGALFRNVGLRTDEALLASRDLEGIHLIGSGGLRSGVDLALAMMLGAELGAAAKPFLEPALESAEACAALLAQWELELKTAMFCVGAKNFAELRGLTPLR